MEMNGEQIIKKGFKTPKYLIWGYVICIIAIIGSTFVMGYRQENEKPEAIDFTTNGAIGMEIDKYAYLNVEGLTDEVAIYGDTENEKPSENDRYYIAISGRYMYIVDLDFDTIEQLKGWQDYLYSDEENPAMPEPVTIYGMTEEIPYELKNYVLEFYNKSVGEEYALTLADFENYFGSVLLNVRREPVETLVEEMIIIFSIAALIVIFVTHVMSKVISRRIKKYLKENEYEEDLAHQLDDFVEEKYFKDKIIITRDFFVDLKSGKLIAFKFADVKWLHIHNVKYYGIVTVSSSITVHLKDGKTEIKCLETNGKAEGEFLEVYQKICEKVPADCLKGYTQENGKAFLEYKKELKNNK